MYISNYKLIFSEILNSLGKTSVPAQLLKNSNHIDHIDEYHHVFLTISQQTTNI